jgi:Uma2 family endonuclease
MIAKGVFRREDRVELIEGYLFKNMGIGSRHASTVKLLNALLSRELAGLAIVGVQDPVTLNEFSEPEPDITVSRFRADYYRDAHPGPADILFLIEVADTSLTYDRTAKLPVYAANDVPEVWLVDLTCSTLTVHRHPNGTVYREVRTVASDEQVPIPGTSGKYLSPADLGL